jgi:hypothetical protein
VPCLSSEWTAISPTERILQGALRDSQRAL